MTVRFLSTDGGGGLRWRSEWPALALTERGIPATVHRGWPLGIGADDVIVCHRPLGVRTHDLLAEYRDAGLTVLISEDDDIRALPSSFDWQVRKRSEQVRQSHDDAIAEADGLIVTTAELLDVYGPMAKRTWLLPNLIAGWVLDLEPWKPNPDRPPRVGWAAVVHVHRHDLRWLAPAAESAFRDATFHWVGSGRPGDWAPDLLGLSKNRQRYVIHDAEFDPFKFYRLMGEVDIGIVPLDPNEQLNRSKSACKALEYMALGKPVVGVDLPEQASMIVHGETGFVAKTPREFAGYVQELVHDEELRHQMGKAGKERALEFTAEDGGDGWAAMAAEVTGA